MQNIQFTHNLQ